MELVDIYNNKHERLNYEKNRKKLEIGEYKLFCIYSFRYFTTFV